MAARWVWVSGIALGVLAVGGIAYAASSSPSSGPLPPAPSPPPAPAPPQAQHVTPSPVLVAHAPKVTDPVPHELVGDLQQMISWLGMHGHIRNAEPYAPALVDGKADNPIFVIALKVFQKDLAAGGAHITQDGTADWASWAVALIDYCIEHGRALPGDPIRDPALVVMAQTALSSQTKVPVGSFAVDGKASSPAFVSAVKAFQAEMVSPKMVGLRTDGTLDYFTLAGILIQAYVQP